MNFIKTRISILFLVIFFFGCTNHSKVEKESVAVKKDGVEIIRQPYENSPNATEYEIPVLKGTQIRHGIQKRFYEHGSLYSEIPYVNGKRNGIAYTYYPATFNAKPVVWKEQPYINDVLEGVCRRYHRNGNLQAEYEYRNGLPAAGLKEYTTSGKLIKMPELVLSKSIAGQNYLITARLTDNSQNVNFYIGKLIEDKYFPENLKGLQVRNNTGELLVPLNSEEISIIAVLYTDYTNMYITAKTLKF